MHLEIEFDSYQADFEFEVGGRLDVFDFVIEIVIFHLHFVELAFDFGHHA
jgi:hypothetical protein